MRDRMMRFMYGRNGVDEFGRAENIFILVLLVISLFVKWLPLYLVCMLLIVHMYYRVFSKNIAKRQEENRKYTTLRYQWVVWKNKKVSHIK